MQFQIKWKSLIFGLWYLVKKGDFEWSRGLQDKTIVSAKWVWKCCDWLEQQDVYLTEIKCLGITATETEQILSWAIGTQRFVYFKMCQSWLKYREQNSREIRSSAALSSIVGIVGAAQTAKRGPIFLLIRTQIYKFTIDNKIWSQQQKMLYLPGGHRSTKETTWRKHI